MHGKRRKDATSNQRREELYEKIRNAVKEIMKSHRREQRMNEEKLIQSMGKNPKVLFSNMNKEQEQEI